MLSFNGKDVLHLSTIAIKGVRFLRVQVDMSGPIRAVHQTSLAIEQAKPQLFIEEASISSPQQRYAQLNRVGVPTEPVIDAKIVVIGPTESEDRNR